MRLTRFPRFWVIACSFVFGAPCQILRWRGPIPLLRAKKGMLAIAEEVGVGSGTVQRIKREMEATGPFENAEAA